MLVEDVDLPAMKGQEDYAGHVLTLMNALSAVLRASASHPKLGVVLSGDAVNSVPPPGLRDRRLRRPDAPVYRRDGEL